MAKRDEQKKLADVRSVPFWWHSIDLGDGVITPGQTSLAVQELRAASVPRALRGKTVLDVGCWDGYFSFLCERRGAIVTPVDNYQYKSFVKSKYGVELKGGEGFRVAARWLGSKLAMVKLDFTRVKGQYDIVLFLGILYHQRHPLLSLEHLFRLTRDWAIIETHYLKDESEPVLQFYPGSSLNRDPTNYWGPSLGCVELMLREVGFRTVRLVNTYWDNDDRAIFVAQK